MTKGNVEKFKEQAFRRIGYTVGLWELLRFGEICELINGKGSLDRKALVSLVQRRFSLGQKDAAGKLDVAKALGLLSTVGDRFVLSEYGRALVALVHEHGAESVVIKAFLLKQVTARDADLTLTLLSTIHNPLDGDVGKAFLRALDALLTLKRTAYSEALSVLSLKKQLRALLTVRESQQKTWPAFTRKTTIPRDARQHEYLCIEIPINSLDHYVRHTITPRRGWLADLSLIRKGPNGGLLSDCGLKLIRYASANGLLIDEHFLVVEPDEDCLLDVCGRPTVIGMRAINDRFYAELVSATYGTGKLENIELSSSDFLDLVASGYSAVKIEAFEQAQVAALKEVVTTPFLIRGQFLDFSTHLERLVRDFPDRVYRLSSRTAAGAYISLKKKTA